MSRRAWLWIAGAELRMLWRSPLTVVLAAVLPTALAALIVWAEGDTGRAGWGAAAGLLLVTVIAFTGYVAGTTALVVRRQQSVLKRLRGSGASDLAIIAGSMAPFALLALAQSVLLFGIVVVAGDAAPASPWLLAGAAGAGTALACVLAVASAAFTSAPELAQVTTTPVGLAMVGGGFWAASTPTGDVTAGMLAVPGVAVTQLVRLGWRGAAPSELTGAAVALALLILVATPLAVRAFRWDLRR